MKKQVIVGRVLPDHPNGQYTVCGCTFTTIPTAFTVTAEEAAQIEADRYVIKAQFGSLTWCEAQGIPFTEEELKKLGLDGNAQPLKKAPGKPQDTTKEAEAGKDSSKDIEAPVVKSKRQLIDELKAKGKVEGEDFNKDAKNEDLQAILDAA